MWRWFVGTALSTTASAKSATGVWRCWITTSKSVQTEPVKGFDIKYEGLNLGRLKFTLLDYSKADGDSGYFRNVSYPYQPGGILDLNGVGIKVIQATNEKLDYIILK